MKLRRNKNEERAGKLLLKELPYFSFGGCLALCHGQFNSSISDTVQPRRNLDKLTSLYDLGIFNLNTVLDVNLSTDCNLPNQRIQKTSNEAFQAIWIEISFVNHKNIVCGIIYRQHNSTEYFQSYFEEVIEKMVSDDKTVYISWGILI